MRKIKTIDDITKDGKVEFGEGYEFVSTAEEADAILMRSTDPYIMTRNTAFSRALRLVRNRTR